MSMGVMRWFSRNRWTCIPAVHHHSDQQTRQHQLQKSGKKASSRMRCTQFQEILTCSQSGLSVRQKELWWTTVGSGGTQPPPNKRPICPADQLAHGRMCHCDTAVPRMSRHANINRKQQTLNITTLNSTNGIYSDMFQTQSRFLGCMSRTSETHPKLVVFFKLSYDVFGLVINIWAKLLWCCSAIGTLWLLRSVSVIIIIIIIVTLSLHYKNKQIRIHVECYSCKNPAIYTFSSYTGRGAVLMHHCRHEGEPACLAESVRRTSRRNIRRHTRSNGTVTLLVPPTRRSTLETGAFPVAAARAWNALPACVRSAPSLSIFHCQRKTHLFRVSFTEQSDYYCSDLTFHTRFLSHFILFFYFCTVVLQQLHAAVPLKTYNNNNNTKFI